MNVFRDSGRGDRLGRRDCSREVAETVEMSGRGGVRETMPSAAYHTYKSLVHAKHEGRGEASTRHVS